MTKSLIAKMVKELDQQGCLVMTKRFDQIDQIVTKYQKMEREFVAEIYKNGKEESGSLFNIDPEQYAKDLLK